MKTDKREKNGNIACSKFFLVETVEMIGVEKKQMFKLRDCADNWPMSFQFRADRCTKLRETGSANCDVSK